MKTLYIRGWCYYGCSCHGFNQGFNSLQIIRNIIEIKESCLEEGEVRGNLVDSDGVVMQ